MGNGRVYRVHLGASDPSGNVGTASFLVTVPKDKGGPVAVDDGPDHVVKSSCRSAGSKLIIHSDSLPTEFGMAQNYPNPLNPSTTIRFQIPKKEGLQSVPTVLRVYDVRGRLVSTLMDESLSPGFYSVQWDGIGDNGKRFGSGLYFYTITAGDFHATKKLIILK